MVSFRRCNCFSRNRSANVASLAPPTAVCHANSSVDGGGSTGSRTKKQSKDSQTQTVSTRQVPRGKHGAPLSIKLDESVNMKVNFSEGETAFDSPMSCLSESEFEPFSRHDSPVPNSSKRIKPDSDTVDKSVNQIFEGDESDQEKGTECGPVTPKEIESAIKEATKQIEVHFDVLRAETVTTKLLNAVSARGVLEPQQFLPAQRIKHFLEGEDLRFLLGKLEQQLACYWRIADVFCSKTSVNKTDSESGCNPVPTTERASLKNKNSARKQSTKSSRGSRMSSNPFNNAADSQISHVHCPSPADAIKFHVPSWRMVYESAEGRVFICCASSTDYAIRFDVMIPHPLNIAMVPFEESDLWPLWMPAIKKPANVWDEISVLRRKISVQPNILGLLKFEVIGELSRFINADTGFIFEEFASYPPEKAKPLAQTRNTLMQTLNYRAWFPTTQVVDGQVKDAVLYSDITFNKSPVGVPERILAMGSTKF